MTDDNFLKWLEARFDVLKGDMKNVLSQLASLDTQHQRCRDHCDTTSGIVFKRIETIEQHNIAHDAGLATKNGMAREFSDAEDKRIQHQQAFWIKMGVFTTVAVIVSSFLSAALANYLVKQ